MRIGVHLPVMGTGAPLLRAAELATYARTAEALGFTGIAVSEHVVHRAPWLDALTALTIAATATTTPPLVTAVVLPGLRPPAVLAKALGALDAVSGGRIIAGLSAGASAADYAACGIPFAARWQRLDASIRILRELWRSAGLGMTPLPAQPDGPPIWIGSWGAPAGLHRAARLGDGWLASAFNTTPDKFAKDWATVQDLAIANGKDPATFQNGVASLFFHLADDRCETERVVRDALSPALGRPADELLPRVLTDSAADFAARLDAFGAAGAQNVFVWPIIEPIDQIERFAAEVLPLLRERRTSNP